MRIINITYKNTLVPKSGSGTGYSEPDLFNVTFEDGSVKSVYIDTWYMSPKAVREEFYATFPYVTNLEEAFMMYLKAQNTPKRTF